MNTTSLTCEQLLLIIQPIVEIGTLLLAITSGIFALCQWRQSIKLKRAEYLNDITTKIRTDSSIRKTVYMFDYGTKWYSGQFHNCGIIEYEVDYTLSYFSYLCYLNKQCIIEDDEFSFFRYDINRILANNQVVDYLYNLYHFANRNNSPVDFYYLIEYAKANKLISSDFYDKEAYKMSGRYHRYLNF